TLDSTIVSSSCTSTGTTPRGFIALNSGVRCSPLARLRWWFVHGTSFSARTNADLLGAHRDVVVIEFQHHRFLWTDCRQTDVSQPGRSVHFMRHDAPTVAQCIRLSGYATHC